jgi:LSD1 subclass zinc finger protein
MPSGEIRSWPLDLEAMASSASWASSNPDRLTDEVTRILGVFPGFLASVGRPLSRRECTVEAAEPLLCPRCRELLVFDRGTRCSACQTPVTTPPDTMVGLIGRIPALISGRPFADSLRSRMEQLAATGDSRLDRFESSLIHIEGKEYLAPRFGLWFSRLWPQSEPPVMVWPEYFEVLDIPAEHVFRATPYYRLCLYASWLEQPAVSVLQNRVLPRLLIDLMIADLQALARLNFTLDRLGTTLYDVYNTVGRSAAGESFRAAYDDVVGGYEEHQSNR